jgi:ABC-type bacteriocin/lantibiotic exporter with double-glycine peptidase domain
VIGQTSPAISAMAINAFVIALGAVMVMRGELSLGGIVAVQLIAGLLAGPVAAIATSLTQVQEATGALMRVGDILENPVDPAFSLESQTALPKQRTGVLTLRGVTFGFNAGTPVFSNVDLDLVPGRFVALLGPSGTGKSSLAKICAGLASPHQGQVLLDGIPLRDWDQGELRGELQYVPQVSAVFSGSLEDNITLWNGEMSNEAMVRAIEWAGLRPVIGKKRNGILTQIAGSDAELSGGEAQRLALARALARKPKLLILDETTSALDPRTEADILASLRASGAGVLLITHRRRTAMMCDEAVLLGHGRLLMRGEPARVLAGLEAVSAPIEERMTA